MRFSPLSIVAGKTTWIEDFESSAISGKAGEDGSNPIAIITVAGLQKTPGKANTKGNIVVEVPLSEADDFLAELSVQSSEGRPMTPAEIIRRSAGQDDDGFTFRLDSKIQSGLTENNLHYLIDELAYLADGGREQTAAECVRRSASIDDDGVLSFRTSEVKGTRTAKIPADARAQVHAIFSSKINAIRTTWEAEIAKLAKANAEAAASAE